MSAVEAPKEPPPAVVHYVLLALVMIAILTTHLLASRPIVLADVPDVAHVADIPPGADRAELRRYIDLNFYSIPKSRLRPQIAAFLRQGAPDEEPPVKLGYSVRTVCFLGLPFLAYKEAGYVLYVESPERFLSGPIGDEGLALLQRQTGVPVGKDWVFPFWAYGWGWLAVIAVAAWALLEWRAQVRRRAALGLI